MAIVQPNQPANPNQQPGGETPVAPQQSPAIPGAPPGTHYGPPTTEEKARQEGTVDPEAPREMTDEEKARHAHQGEVTKAPKKP